MNFKFEVAQHCGGIMEQPVVSFKNPQTIIASSEEEAREIYDSRYSCYYFTGTVIGNKGQTFQPKTSKKYIDVEEEINKRKWKIGGNLPTLEKLEAGDIFITTSKDVMKEYVKLNTIDEEEVRVQRIGFNGTSVMSKDTRVLKVGRNNEII